MTTSSTLEYGQFSRLQGNRPLVEKHVLALVHSIEAVGNLTSKMPVQVNKDLEILDGQHRLEACRRLGLPIYYEIIDNMTIAEVRTINRQRRNWTWQDYGYSYAAGGLQSYQDFMQLYEAYAYPFAVLLQAVGTHDHAENFRSGQLVVKDMPGATQKLEQLQACIAVLQGFGFKASRSFMLAMLNIFNAPGYTQGHMLAQFKAYGGQLSEWLMVSDSMQNIEHIYNLGLSSKGAVKLY